MAFSIYSTKSKALIKLWVQSISNSLLCLFAMETRFKVHLNASVSRGVTWKFQPLKHPVVFQLHSSDARGDLNEPVQFRGVYYCMRLLHRVREPLWRRGNCPWSLPKSGMKWVSGTQRDRYDATGRSATSEPLLSPHHIMYYTVDGHKACQGRARNTIWWWKTLKAAYKTVGKCCFESITFEMAFKNKPFVFWVSKKEDIARK